MEYKSCIDSFGPSQEEKGLYKEYISAEGRGDRKAAKDLQRRILSSKIWAPSIYMSAYPWNDRRGIFSWDEGNAFGLTQAPGTIEEEVELSNRVLRGPRDRGSFEAKVDGLFSNSEWRENAKEYSTVLLRAVHRRFTPILIPEFQPVMEDLFSEFSSQMG